MRRFLISTLSSRRAAYHAFSRHPTTILGGAAPPQDGGRQTTWLMNMHCYMSTQTNPLRTKSYNETNIKDEERDAIKIEVISREHIKPTSPTPESLRHYKLSFFDQAEPPIHHPFLFFFPPNNNNNNNNKNTEEIILDRSNLLKQSLSEALTQMRPFAGKVASELHIDCNDEGVYYVETRVDERLNNVLQKPDFKFLKRLIPDINQPLMSFYVSMVQVNFFKCGGVSITFQHNHKLADARSSIAFLNTWAAIARRDPNQVYPNFISSSMFPQNPSLPFAPYIPLWYLMISPPIYQLGKSSTSRFVFNALALKELKAKASKHQPVSRVLAVLALLWKCATAETHSKPSVVHVPVDIRQRFSPPLPESSIGNIKSGAMVKFDPDTTNLDLASMASKLKDTIADINYESIDELKGVDGHVKFVEELRNAIVTRTDYNCEYYLTSSVCNSGTKEADFGWGKPVWACTGNQMNEDIPMFVNRMVLMDSCSGDGIEAWVTLEKQVMDGFKCNGELLSFASVDPSPL